MEKAFSRTIAPASKSFWLGVRAELPLLIGVIPFGLIYGALALKAGLSPATAQLMSSVVFAGSAQFAAAQLIHDGAPALILVLTIAMINLRHMLYSASLAPYLRDLSTRWKTLLSYLLTDEAYAVVVTHYQEAGATPTGHWFFLGAGLTLWTTWQLSTALGIFAGTAIPDSWPLDFALPLTFIALVVPALKDRPAVAAALVAAVLAVLTYAVPYKLGFIFASLVGIAVGIWLEGKK